jgi:hypothetical protein
VLVSYTQWKIEFENLFNSDEKMDKLAYPADLNCSTKCTFLCRPLLYIINMYDGINCFQVTLMLSMKQPDKTMQYRYMFPANTQYNLQYFFVSHATILLCLRYTFYTRELCINKTLSSLANNHITYTPIC